MFAIQWDYDEKDNWQYLSNKKFEVIKFFSEDDAKFIMDKLYQSNGHWGDFDYRIVDFPVRKVTAEADS